MDIAERIRPYRRIVPMIYAYTAPGVTYLDGMIKIGYTDKQTVEARIKQQTHTAGIRPFLAWCDNAMYKDGSGEYFHDSDFHHFLTSVKHTVRKPNTEWFKLSVPESQLFFFEFAAKKYKFDDTGLSYTLRREQAEAVAMTKTYYEKGGDEFLWNCKPRFGKTLTAYDLVRTMGFKHVLVVTNRPSIANSWAEDFQKFVGWRTPRMVFVSDADALKGKAGVFTRDAYVDYCLKENEEDVPYICFESLQNLKGSVFLGGKFNKLDWITKMEFDLLIIDESQEGVDTKKTERAFREIQRKHTLYLSGTPFKQLAEGRFSESQIYNWTYADEQKAKAEWDGEEANPYETLPRLSMFTYQISPMVTGQLEQGVDFSEDEHGDYAFDLNEFFLTNESGKFVHEEEVRKFLHALSTQEKYPFSTPELRGELAHTLWYMNRVAAVNAMKKLLKEDPVFKEYEIIVAAGNVRENNENSGDEDSKKAYDKVKKAIATHDKTITLTVGQLTVGVTIPEWSAVLMLCNLKSPSAYMQAAFRAQNPCSYTSKDGMRYMKETAYVFDFDPSRTLMIYDQFANDLMSGTVNGSGTEDDRRGHIRELLNFFPVLGEDAEGTMVELDAEKVLSIPRRLVSEDIVRHGFMDNKLFDHISNVFGAPKLVQKILEKITPAQEEPTNRHAPLPDAPDVPLDDDGNVDIPNEIVIGTSQGLFGDKVYGEVKDTLEKPMEDILHATETDTPQEKMDKSFEDYKKNLADSLTHAIIPPLGEQYGITKGTANRMGKHISHAVNEAINTVKEDYTHTVKVAEAHHADNVKNAETEEEVKAADEELKRATQEANEKLITDIQSVTEDLIHNKPPELVKELETRKAEQEKKGYEDKIRDHLRGFSRTIPSFLMAYGDRDLTLGNLDDYTEDDVFAEVTGITEADFRLLRDGGELIDEETGEKIQFAGHLFNEDAFNDSVQNFLDKKEKLANYFDEEQEKDIFDYIPPQKTNQIFTPRWVVEKMADELEKENPGCFDNPRATFADLYMKSGLYITEIVKRLFRSEKMKELYPDDKKRIRHILKKQVYGMAPSRIIYLIAINYIMGFDKDLKKENPHFVEEDAAEAAKNGTLQKAVDSYWGK